MKQPHYILLMVLVTLFSPSRGQISSGYGVKAGLSVANQSWRLSEADYTFETEALSSYTVALFVETWKGDHFSFQLDAAYASKGSITRVESVSVRHLEGNILRANTGEVSTSEFSYISLSPMARYRFDLERLVPYLLLGPRIDLLLNYTSDSEYPLESWKGYIVGLSLGAGMEYSFTKLNIFAEIQYQPDLSPLTNQEPLLINNEMLAITLGLRRLVSF
jgi:opacity protein-like surface antigen